MLLVAEVCPRVAGQATGEEFAYGGVYNEIIKIYPCTG